MIAVGRPTNGMSLHRFRKHLLEAQFAGLTLSDIERGELQQRQFEFHFSLTAPSGSARL
jgi:hypothetical protein